MRSQTGLSRPLTESREMRLVSIPTDRQRPHVPPRDKASYPRNRYKREGPVAQTTGERTDIEGETGGCDRGSPARSEAGEIDQADRSTAVRRERVVPESLREPQEGEGGRERGREAQLDVLPGTVYEEQEVRFETETLRYGSRWSNSPRSGSTEVSQSGRGEPGAVWNRVGD
ncbi:hypothetical protein PVAR5_3986 [Paecilomyces variotii No. 5]|uniref:Uncharacterized protein n=1 Tax=Byssochlamys spectabilis (strain No. 5 / NBRC 109023) TaxID=1356009 RepID=V5FDI8_BYSSN|nr:hypothetical protein PVAR5_3986 [Paecilomyces variotii No. 5]